MEGEIIEQLKLMGKITDEDVSEALKLIPTEEEMHIIRLIKKCYTDIPEGYEDEKSWFSHFLPILREESFKVIEKVRELNSSNNFHSLKDTIWIY